MNTYFSHIDIDRNFPLNYFVELDSFCSLKNPIEEVATFVSKVYAKFPRMNEEEVVNLQNQGVNFEKSKEFPSIRECDDFENALKRKIILLLNDEKKSMRVIHLSTDYSPLSLLHTISHSIFNNKSNIKYYFPFKSDTRITYHVDRKMISLDMKFRPILYQNP